MKKAFVVIVTLLSAVFLFAGINAKIIPLTSGLYDDMDAIYAMTGSGVPSNSRPWSVAEAEMILDRVNPSQLGERGMKLYNDIKAEIEKGTRWSLGSAGFGAELEINPEMYFHSNPEFNSEDDWIYSFEQRKHIFMLNLDMNVDSFFYSFCNLMYGYGRWMSDDSGVYEGADFPWDNFANADRNYIGTVYLNDISYSIGLHSDVFTKKALFNMPPHTKDFDFEWPRRAVVSVGGKNWNLNVSRDRVSWGNSHIANFVIDDHDDFNEYLNFAVFSDKFKYEFATVFYETYADQTEHARDTDLMKMMFAHRLEFRPLTNLTFSVSEDVMYEDNKLDLRYINPALIYHNLNSRGVLNAIAYADLDVSLSNGLNLYSEFVLDQATAPNEGDEQAPSWGLLAGAEYTAEFKPFIYTASLEFAYTTPELYRRDEVDFTYFTRTMVFGHYFTLQFNYVGFPYGGDAIVGDLRQSLNFGDLGKLSLDLRAVTHGSMNIFQSHNVDGNNNGWANITAKTPIGNVTKTYSASLNYSVDVTRALSQADIYLNWPKISAFAESDYILVVNNSGKKHDFQTSIGASIVL